MSLNKVMLVDRKKISYLVKKLSEAAPLRDLQHLKRVKSCRNSAAILLWPAEEVDGTLDKLFALGVDTAGLGEISIKKVASRQPVTRAQFEHLREEEDYWPSSFHEDKDLESLRLSTPAILNNCDTLFRNLGNKGIISYTEYLFLLTILIKPFGA